jgi:hypothetical protein
MRATDQFGTSSNAVRDSLEGYRSNERIAHNVWTGYAAHHQPQQVMFLPVVGGGKG